MTKLRASAPIVSKAGQGFTLRYGRGRKDRLDSRSLPPPNRACGSPAHGSPVGGSPRRGLTDRRVGRGKGEQPTVSKESIHLPPFTPVSRVVNMRSVQTEDSTHAHRARTSPTCVFPIRRDTCAGIVSIGSSFTHPPSCAPFAPRQLRRFIATMGAPTPPKLSTAAGVSLLHVYGLPTSPSPTT